MTLTRRSFIATGAAAAGLGSSALRAETAAERGLRIATEASRRDDGFADITVSGEMTLRNPAGRTSTRRFDASWISISARESRSLLIFRWPGDIRNTALLTHTFTGQRDDQWLFLPAMERVRRISGSGRSGSFVGSEFSFEDMVDQEVDKFDYTWIADEPCPVGGGTCHVLDRVPTTNSGYSRQRVWLDTTHLRLQQAHFFDRRNSHLKTLVMSNYQRYSGQFWRAGRMDMTNHLTGATTRMDWDGYQFDQGLSASSFTVSALRRIN